MTPLEKEGLRFRDWLSENQEKEPSDKTLSNYEKFFYTLVSTYGLDIDNLDGVAVARTIRKGKVSTYTKRAYKNALKHYLLSRGVEITPQLKKALKQRLEKTPKYTPNDLITEEELRDIVAHTRSPMLRAYYTMLWDTGARPSELANLDMENVTDDTIGLIINITKSKTSSGVRQVRLMSPIANEQVALWRAYHPKKGVSGTPFFLNKEDRRLSVHPVLNNLRNQHNERLSRGNGHSKKSLNLYLFRKSFATRMIQEGKLKDHEIKRIMGHSAHSTILQEFYLIVSAEDTLNAQAKRMGHVIDNGSVPEKEFLPCPNPACGRMNDPDTTKCFVCGSLLTKEASYEHITQGEQIQELQGQLKQVLELLVTEKKATTTQKVIKGLLEQAQEREGT